jgi:hypothetical protein
MRHKIRVLSFSATFCEILFILKKNSARYHKHPQTCMQSKLLLLGFKDNWIFAKEFRKMIKYQIACQSVQCCSMWIEGQTDKQTDMTKLSSRFSQFGENAWKINRVVACQSATLRHSRAHDMQVYEQWDYMDNGGGSLNFVHCLLQRLRKLGPVDHTLYSSST